MMSKIILRWEQASEQKAVNIHQGKIERDRLIEHGKKIGVDKIKLNYEKKLWNLL